MTAVLLSWLHFFQIFLIALGIVLAAPLVFFVVKAVISAICSVIDFIRWGFKNDK